MTIINCFYSKLLSDGEQVATDMKIKIEQSNYSNLNKYWNSFIEEDFNKVEAVTINDFPKLDMETLKNKITYGSYQLKNSLSYLSEHFNQHGQIEILVKKTTVKDEKINIISALIQSRHIKRTKYRLIIVYSPDKEDIFAIEGWKCSYSVGNRKVGCCSHIVCIIFYLSSGKYKEILKNLDIH